MIELTITFTHELRVHGNGMTAALLSDSIPLKSSATGFSLGI